VAASGSQPALDLNGVTLPGAPLLVAGSNGHIAWGFTNSYGDWVHVQHVACSALGEREMQTPDGGVPLSVHDEEIRVRGQQPVRFPVRTGPVGVLYAAQDIDNIHNRRTFRVCKNRILDVFGSTQANNFFFIIFFFPLLNYIQPKSNKVSRTGKFGGSKLNYAIIVFKIIKALPDVSLMQR